jgi:hypothetical protein
MTGMCSTKARKSSSATAFVLSNALGKTAPYSANNFDGKFILSNALR